MENPIGYKHLSWQSKLLIVNKEGFSFNSCSIGFTRLDFAVFLRTFVVFVIELQKDEERKTTAAR